jgi:hypothetical protein
MLYSQIERHLRYFSATPTFYQNDLALRNTADVTCGKPIAVSSQSISGGALLIFKSPFTTSMEERERYYSFVLSQTPHETYYYVLLMELRLSIFIISYVSVLLMFKLTFIRTFFNNSVF